MNKVFLVLSILFLSFFLFFEYSRGKKNLLTTSFSPLSLTNKGSSQEIQISLDDNSFTVLWWKVRPENVYLYSNLEEQQPSSQLVQAKKCQVLVNGGFYDLEGKPIGLLKIGNKTFSDFQKNQVFNAVVYKKSGKLEIAKENGFDESVDFILQSGPLLVYNGQTMDIALKKDSSGRRIILAIDKNDDVYFLAIFKKDSGYLGPLLRDLPAILIDVATKLNVSFIHAVNLDGGGASAFHTPTHSLSEISPIGSYFCIHSETN